MKINRMAPWFGCDLAVAGRIAELLRGAAHITIPFAGSVAIVQLLRPRAGIINDLHRHVVNLWRCTKDADTRAEMTKILDATLFHPDELSRAKTLCIERERGPSTIDKPDPAWAAAYFAVCWMGRGGNAGKKTEFAQSLAVRHTASGGSSAKRFQSAIESIDAWSDALKRWECTCMDAFDLLAKTPDHKDNAIYCDPPWVTAGKEYKHGFAMADHERLAKNLSEFKHTRVVARYGDEPLIRELYQERDGWKIETAVSRSQANTDVAELLIVNNPEA